VTDRTPPEALREETIGSERIYDGAVVSLRIDTLRLADDSQVVREVIEHQAAVVILAIDDEGRIAFVRQWRTPIGRDILELPAGGLESGEDPEAAATRELQEEAGLKPGTLEPIHRFYVAPGWATEELHGFIARDCTTSALPADADERIAVEFYNLGEALDFVANGEIEDAKTILMLQACALRAVGPLGAKIWRYYRGE
jgi:ADP-ribose pyrophosphatase